ncbi:Nonribosomal peptide synthetase 8, partial [Tolypocladium ophioglossoides CBS 100239]
MEEQLRQIWANVLCLAPDEIGAEDNLFELGGDSVKAILIIAQAAEHQLYLDIQTLYANATVGTLAKAVRQTAGNGPPMDGDKGEPASDDDLLQRVRRRMEGLGVPQSRVLQAAKLRDDQVDFITMTAQGRLGASSTFIYQVRGPDVEEKLQRAIAALTAKHPMLRSTFVDVDDTLYQVLLADARPTLLVRCGGIKEYAREASARVLAAGDQTAFYALVDDGGTLFFALSILHSFFDGFSRTLVERDLVAALASPGAFAAQPEGLWYGDLARRLDAALDDGDAEAFWQRYLAGSQLETETIYAGAPPPRRRFDRALYATVAAGVVQGRQTHLATAIATAWALALMQRSGARDVAFTMLTLGRLYPYDGIDRLVGLLVKDRPFRLHVRDRAATIESVLLGVQHDLVAAGEYEHGPRFPGKPRLQSYVNVKVGGSAMGAADVAGLTLTPRRDLEHWESESHYAVYLEMKPLAGANRFEMRYHSSLLDGAQAATLLRRFVALLNRIGSAPSAAT